MRDVQNGNGFQCMKRSAIDALADSSWHGSCLGICQSLCSDRCEVFVAELKLYSMLSMVWQCQGLVNRKMQPKLAANEPTRGMVCLVLLGLNLSGPVSLYAD